MSGFLFANVECFRVILADPPWSYDNFGLKKHDAASAHYPTMSYGDLAAIPVAKWAGEESVLVLWGCWPQADKAVDLARAWGFREHVTGFPWIKTYPNGSPVCGPGFWVRGASEFVLISRCGSISRDEEASKPLALMVGEERAFFSVPGKHSARPLGIHEWLEATLPGPRLELFARREREGWTTWGNELGFELGPWGVRACAPFVLAAPEETNP